MTKPPSFDSTPEFQRYKDVMRNLIAVPKAEVDAMVKQASDSSPRKNDPHSPGRKRKALSRTKRRKS